MQTNLFESKYENTIFCAVALYYTYGVKAHAQTAPFGAIWDQRLRINDSTDAKYRYILRRA